MQEETLDTEEDDDDDAESIVSSASMQTASETKTPGYAGLNNRCRQLSNVMNHWGKNLEGMERRITSQTNRAINQAINQLAQQISPENMKAFILDVVKEHFYNGDAQHPPSCQATTAQPQA